MILPHAAFDGEHTRYRVAALPVVVAGCLLVSACAASGSPTDAANATTSGGASAPAPGSQEREVAKLTPRVLIARDGGLTLLDAATGAVISETEHPGFLRLNNAGDGRHVMVTDSDTFRVYDAGIQTQRHGDHKHNYEYAAGLTEVSYAAPKAGHVVLHEGLTTLFADGTGDIQVIDSTKIADPQAKVEKYRTDDPHHGVAMELSDGTLFTTQGTSEARSVIQVKKGDTVVAETRDCPGSHGEAVAQPTVKGDVVAVGCHNGPVILRDGAFHKVPVKDAYARSGNLFGTPTSPIILGDYKVDKAAELERPTRIAFIDTRADTLSLVDLGSSYWFRSLARGPKGEALVLTYDGTLNILDPATRRVVRKVPVIAPWMEKTDWQEPGPAVKVAGSNAYVTDAEKRKLSIVDIPAGKVTHQFDLAHTPVEIAVVTGQAEAPGDHAGHGHEGHKH